MLEVGFDAIEDGEPQGIKDKLRINNARSRRWSYRQDDTGCRTGKRLVWDEEGETMKPSQTGRPRTPYQREMEAATLMTLLENHSHELLNWWWKANRDERWNSLCDLFKKRMELVNHTLGHFEQSYHFIRTCHLHDDVESAEEELRVMELVGLKAIKGLERLHPTEK